MAGLVETMGHGCWGLWVAQWRARVSEECLQLWRAEKGARAKQAQGGAPPWLASALKRCVQTRKQNALPKELKPLFSPEVKTLCLKSLSLDFKSLNFRLRF